MLPGMKRLFLLFALFTVWAGAAEVAKISPAEAAKRVADGQALLVDVREPAEWVETGVATPAVLMPKSEFDDNLSGDWKGFLEKNRDKQIILYCRSGRRSGAVAASLAEKGYNVANAGGFKNWESAGLPVRLVSEAPAKKK